MKICGILAVFALFWAQCIAIECLTSKDGLVHKIEPYGC